MKDPLDTEKRAYEVLGVRRNATPAEINAAYARRTAQDPSMRQELTQAWQQLRKAATRLKEDFWYYPVGDAERIEQKPSEERQALYLDPVLPVTAIEMGCEYTDLADGKYAKDFTQIRFRKIKLSYTDRYDEAPDFILPIVFDR
jgi:hypothetical protein